MKKFLKLFRQIIDIPEHPERSARDIRNVQLCNRFSLTIGTMIVLYSLAYVHLGHNDLAIFNVVAGLLTFAPIVLNRSLRFPRLGRYVYLLSNNSILIFYSTVLGRDSWSHLNYLHMMSIPYLFFSPKDIRSIWGWSLVSPSLFLMMEFWGFKHFAHNVILTPEQQQQFFYASFPNTFVIGFLFVNYLYNVINKSEQDLQAKITELQVKKKQIADQQLQLATAAKFSAIGELSGSIAHEINNPLAIIKGFASQIWRLINQNDINPERILPMAKRITDAVDRITKITYGLLSLSREGGEDPFEPVDLRSIVDDVLVICRESFAFDHITVTVEAAGPMICECRHVQIAQVVLNILQNAKDAILAVDEKWISIQVRACDDMFEIAIIDSGRGISPEHMAQIYQPFFTTKPPGKGTGLGLSISRKILVVHQGDLYIDENAKHTTFVIRLPAKSKNTKQAVAVASS